MYFFEIGDEVVHLDYISWGTCTVHDINPVEEDEAAGPYAIRLGDVESENLTFLYGVREEKLIHVKFLHETMNKTNESEEE